MNRVPQLLLAWLYRSGCTPALRDGKLLIANPSQLCDSDRDMVVQYKAELIILLQRGSNSDPYRWPARVDTPEHRAQALPRPLPQSEPPGEAQPAEPEPEPPGGWEFTCRRCGAHRYVDTPIHDGRSARRDCGTCRLTDGFPVWDPAPVRWNGVEKR